MSPSLCIHNAVLVSATGARPGGILATDGMITALLEPTDRPAADTSIDGECRLLFPGFVDTHVHLRDPGLTYKEDFSSGSMAAACGGVTTVMCMPNTKPPLADIGALALARAAGQEKSYVDFCLQGSITANNLGEVAPLWREGVSSFEINLSDGAEGPSVERIDDDDLLLDIMRRVAAIDAPLGMYTGHQAITARAVPRLQATGRRDSRAHAEARPPIAEVVGVAKALELALDADAKVVFREVTTKRALELLRRGKKDRRAGAVLVEVTPHHVLLTDDVIDRLGSFAQIVPPLRSEIHRLASLGALVDGTVDFVGSDHAPHSADEKTDDAWRSRNGTPGLETCVPALMDLVARGLLTYQDVCRVFSTAPAQAFGLGGRKGTLAVGADADFALVDPSLRRALTPERSKSKMKRSALEGVELSGWPVLTVLRGDVVMENSQIIGPPRGQFVAGQGYLG